MMHKVKMRNLIITLVLLAVVAGFIVYIFNNEYGFFRTAYEDIRSNAEELLGIDKPVETHPPVEVPDYIGQENPDYTVFEEFNKNLHDIANDTNDYENSYLTKRRIDNLKELYTSKAGTEHSSVDYYTNASNDAISLKVIESYITYNEDDIEIPTNAWVGFEKYNDCHTSDGELIDGYVYCVVKTEITNTGNKDIGLMMTNPITSLNFMDDKGELYWEVNMCNFISFQPGDSAKYAYYYYDFKAGETITNSFVYTIPVAALEFFDCCFTVNGQSSSGFQPETSSMVILDIQNKTTNN